MAFKNVKLLKIEFAAFKRIIGFDTYRLFPIVGEVNGRFWLKDIGQI